MTGKQARAIANVVENGGNVSKAMRDAGYSPATAHTPSKLMAAPGVQEALQKVLAEHNLTIDRTAKVIDEALDAAKQNQFTGEINPDHTVRLKAADMLHGLMGLKGTKQEPPKADPLNPATAKELAEAIRNGDEVQVTHAVWGKKDGS